MKTKYILLMLLGVFVYQTAVHAETVSGVVTSVDTGSHQITLTRDGGQNESVTISVNDASALANLRDGSQVTLNADKTSTGAWEAQSLEGAPPLSGSNVGTNMNTGGSTGSSAASTNNSNLSTSALSSNSSTGNSLSGSTK